MPATDSALNRPLPSIRSYRAFDTYGYDTNIMKHLAPPQESAQALVLKLVGLAARKRSLKRRQRAYS
eukprot:4440119-Amphidinium_carterae.1